ncbi:hypothetical protein ACF060_33620 [Streptomyces werraensis]|uniref:hypothetical protein n=1 Tax=Streptomyces werraensis TaxID=68284 RepID=UPI0036FFB6B1
MSHEHDLALALRELLERAAAGQGTRREKAVAARARAAATEGAMWGGLYGQQPEAEADEPGEDVFGRQRGRRGALDRRRRPEHLAG